MCDYISMDYNEIVNFICKNNTCVLSVTKNNLPYAVPMYYKAYNDCGNIHLKLRSKDIGKKMNYMYTNENVCILIMSRNLRKTVIINGIANMDNNCNDNTVNIDVCIKEVTGRKFCF